MARPLDPAHIVQTATAFWSSKVLLTAVEFDLFSTLGGASMTASELGDALGIHPRGRYDFFDALVALEFLERDGDGPQGRYRNTPETAAFLDRSSPRYIGGVPEMMNARLFGFWNHLGTALRTGEPQTEVKTHGRSMFEQLYADEERLGTFLAAMSRFQAANFERLAEKFDFSRYATVSDVGGALALLSRTVGARHPHLKLTSFDLPPVAPHARRHVEAAGLAPHPQGPRRAPRGRRVHRRREPDRRRAPRERVRPADVAQHLIEFGDAFDYTAADFRAWCAEAGFRTFDVIPLTGPTSAAVAYK